MKTDTLAREMHSVRVASDVRAFNKAFGSSLLMAGVLKNTRQSVDVDDNENYPVAVSERPVDADIAPLFSNYEEGGGGFAYGEGSDAAVADRALSTQCQKEELTDVLQHCLDQTRYYTCVDRFNAAIFVAWLNSESETYRRRAIDVDPVLAHNRRWSPKWGFSASPNSNYHDAAISKLEVWKSWHKWRIYGEEPKIAPADTLPWQNCASRHRGFMKTPPQE